MQEVPPIQEVPPYTGSPAPVPEVPPTPEVPPLYPKPRPPVNQSFWQVVYGTNYSWYRLQIAGDLRQNSPKHY